MTKSQITGGAIVWQSGMNIDADGSPRAYHPQGGGLDALGNAGKPGNWWGLACNGSGVPYVQGDGDPAPGFYVSTTALVDRARPASDPRRYVDSSTIPYVSVPRELLSRGVKMGDVAWIVYRDRQCGAVVADVGPAGRYGEGSIALAEALIIPSSPRTGGIESGVRWCIFPGSSRGWPRDRVDVNVQAQQLFSAWGGYARLSAAVAQVA